MGLDLVYTLTMIPAEDVVSAYEEVVLPLFTQHFPDSEEVQSFLHYFELTYIGRILLGGDHGNPLFPHDMWNIRTRVLNDQHTTNNRVESWNARWNNSLGTNHNIFSVIKAFMKEDALARQKFQEMVAGRDANPNPRRQVRRSIHLERMKIAMSRYTRENKKEFMYMMRKD